MKKISIMFLLVLALAFVSCSQAEAGDGKQQTSDKKTTGASPRQTGTSQEASDEEMADEEKQVRAEQLATETAEAYKALKDKRDEYSSKISKAKAAYEALATGTTAQQNRVQIPTGVTGFTEADLPQFYASLGYENDLIEKLDTVIKGLSISDVNAHAKEIKIANGIFNLLVELEDATKKILDEHLKDANLTKIEKDKDKIEKATAELKSFIASRDDFIKGIKKSIETVLDTTKTKSSAEAKAELDKIITKTSATSSAAPGDAGYCHSKVEAVKKNETALASLFN